MGWDVTSPAGTTPRSEVDNVMRTDKATLLNVLSEEHEFSASSSPTSEDGQHKAESARIGRGTAAAKGVSTSALLTGRLFQETDTRKLMIADGDSWEQLLPAMNLREYAVGLEADVALTNSTDWAQIPINGGGDPFEFEYTSLGGALLILCNISLKVQYGPVYLSLEVDDANVSALDQGLAVAFSKELVLGPGAGTVSISAGSTTVTGSGTAFGSYVRAGDKFRTALDPNYDWEVASVDSNTQLTLTSAYATARSAKAFYIRNEQESAELVTVTMMKAVEAAADTHTIRPLIKFNTAGIAASLLGDPALYHQFNHRLMVAEIGSNSIA